MATKTLGLTGRDYSTLAAWATYVNALSLAANEILEVYNDSGAVADTASVTVGGWTANGFSVTMRSASGQGIADNANRLTNALRWNASNGAALTNSVGYDNGYVFSGTNLVVQGLQFRATASTAASVVRVEGGGSISRCILWKTSGGVIVVQGLTGFTLNDSLMVSAAGTATSGVSLLAAGLAISNCTIACLTGTGKGIKQPYAVAPVVKNTVVYGFSTDYEGTAGSGSTNNATSAGSFGGTGWGTSGQVSVTSADFENVSSGTEDFRAKSSGTKLPNLGAASVGSGSDVVGTTRSATPTIGAWEVAASGGSTVNPGAGAMVFAGLAPTLTVSSNRTVSPGVGALSLAGLAPQPGLPFNSSTYEFGQRTGLTLSDYAIFASTSLNVSVYADSDLLLATRLFAYTETTSSIGRLSFKTNAALAAGTTYFFVARDATGLLCGCGRITAAP